VSDSGVWALGSGTGKSVALGMQVVSIASRPLRSEPDCRGFPFVLRYATRDPFDIRCPGALLPFPSEIAGKTPGPRLQKLG
jgi:hypothetical protein